MNTKPTDGPATTPPPRAPQRVAIGLLWLLFASLVMAGGWLFLRACGLDAIGLDFCPAHADALDARRESEVGNELVRQVHMAQLAVAEAPVCAPPAPPAPVTPAPAAPAVVAPPRRAETEAIDRKVVERGGRNGTLQFTLTWPTRDDLDINVDCPGGRIDGLPGHGGPGICGDGRKDIDANRNLTDNVSTSPIENVVWQSDIPQGQYKIEIIEYKAASNLGNTVPFTLRVRWNGQERICNDVVTTTPGPSQTVAANGRIIGGSARVLAWTLGDDLPACDFAVIETYRNGPAK